LEALILSLSRYDLSTEGLPVTLWRLSLAAIARFSTLAMLENSFASLADDSNLSLCSDTLTERFGPNSPEHGWFILASDDSVAFYTAR
jgi:hypothetical protein